MEPSTSQPVGSAMPQATGEFAQALPLFPALEDPFSFADLALHTPLDMTLDPSLLDFANSFDFFDSSSFMAMGDSAPGLSTDSNYNAVLTLDSDNALECVGRCLHTAEPSPIEVM